MRDEALMTSRGYTAWRARRCAALGPVLLLGCLALLSGRPAASAQTGLVELAPDGIWTWLSDERAVILDGVLYSGYITSKGKVGVSSYDPASGAVAHSGPLSEWTQIDDHNNPSLIGLADGRLMAVYTRHFASRYETRVTESPGVVTNWAEARVQDPNMQITFSHLYGLDAGVTDDGPRIHNFTRAIAQEPCVAWTDDRGETWTELLHFIESPNPRHSPYVKMYGDGRNRIDAIVTDAHPRNNPTNNVYHFYCAYDEEGIGGFYRTDGSLIRTFESIRRGTGFAPRDATYVYGGTNDAGRALVQDVARDPAGNVAAVYSTRTGANDLRYRYARWDEAEKTWTEGQVAFAGNYLYRPEFDFAGGIVLDPDDVNVVYFSTNVDPATGTGGTNTEYEIYRGFTIDRGATWQFIQLTRDSPVKNIRPFVPRGHPAGLTVLWCRGTYEAYDRYQTAIVGLFSDGEP